MDLGTGFIDRTPAQVLERVPHPLVSHDATASTSDYTTARYDMLPAVFA